MSLAPTHIDGATFIGIAVCTALLAAVTSDEAAKILTADIIFWSKCSLNSINAGLLALKMFRSQSYAAYVEQKKQNGTAPPFKTGP